MSEWRVSVFHREPLASLLMRKVLEWVRARELELARWADDGGRV